MAGKKNVDTASQEAGRASLGKGNSGHNVGATRRTPHITLRELGHQQKCSHACNTIQQLLFEAVNHEHKWIMSGDQK